MLTLSVLIEQLDTVGSVSICLIHSKKCKSMLQSGYGFIITNDHTRPIMLDRHYTELMPLFSKDYALTSFEMESGYKKLQEALLSYGDYVNELQRYGNSGQVQTAQDIQQWMRDLYADFHMQYGTAQQVQKTVRELLLNGDPDN